MFWVPQSGDIGMGVSIISYNGEVQFGLITDRGLCPDPGARSAARFDAEFEKLVLDDADGAVAQRRRPRSGRRRGAGRLKRRTIVSPAPVAGRRTGHRLAAPAPLFQLRLRELDVEPLHRVERA